MYNNPSPMRRMIYFVDDVIAERQKLKEDYVWYLKAMRTLYRKPMLRQQIENILSLTYNKYYGAEQCGVPPLSGSSVQKLTRGDYD